MIRRLSPPLLGLLLAVLPLAGCTKNGGSSAVSGLSLPSEVSAVSAKGSSSSAHPAASPQTSQRVAISALERLRATVRSGPADLPADSDYQTVVVRKFVEIEVLELFTIIKQIFDAFRQTHYADAGNVNTGPYQCMVAWEDEGQGGSTQVNLETWVIDSALISVNGTSTNRVHGWIEETDDQGQPRLVRVQVDIEQAPTRNSDGTLADLGVWEIRALFGTDDATQDHFFADAAIMGDGTSRLRIQDQSIRDNSGTPYLERRRGIIFRSASLGYGKAEYPDWSACNSTPCPSGPPSIEVAFSYNDNYLTVDDGTGNGTTSFDRNDEHTIAHRYGIFNAADGANINRSKEFGFPVSLAGGRFAWYGAWQDHHQLWAPGTAPADGDTATRQGLPPGQTPPTYTVKNFSGALTRINLVTGSLDQVLGVPADIFLFNNLTLVYNGGMSRWEECVGNDGMGGCSALNDYSARLADLEYNGSADQRSIFVSGCGMSGCTNYVYVTGSPSGFHAATFNNSSGRWESSGGLYSPSNGDRLNVSVGGRTYIMYTGEFSGPTSTSGWVEKSLTAFDTSTWTPTFDPAGDHQFNFELDRQYFINNRGTNLRVTRVAQNGDADDYQLYMEVQRVAKPNTDLDTIYPPGTILEQGWDPAANSSYALETSAADPDYLLLKYVAVSAQDLNNGHSVGDVVVDDLWGLRVQGDAAPLASAFLYNWQYQGTNDFQGGVTYLLDGNSNYVLLDEPLHFQPVKLPRTTDLVNNTPQGSWLNFSLMYDGNLHGLPDTWYELEKVGFRGSQVPDILANNVVIPDGTELVDSHSVPYYTRILDAGIFLGEVTTFPLGPQPDLTQATGIDLTADIPAFVVPSISATVPDAVLTYIEGIPVH